MEYTDEYGNTIKETAVFGEADTWRWVQVIRPARTRKKRRTRQTRILLRSLAAIRMCRKSCKRICRFINNKTQSLINSRSRHCCKMLDSCYRVLPIPAWANCPAN